MKWLKNVFNRIKADKAIIRLIPLVIVAVILIVTVISSLLPEAPEVIESPSPSAEPSISVTPPPAPTPSRTPRPSPTPAPTPAPSVTPVVTGPVNPLTGMPVDKDISMNKPAAIMINDAWDAMPQVGVSDADIIYETLVEGGITRMLALYQESSKAGVIGSVRSSRHYFIDLAQSHDAVYIFAGGSPQAYRVLANSSIEHLDGVSGTGSNIYRRDPDRAAVMSYEHTLVTSGELLGAWLPEYISRLEHKDGYEQNFSFSDDGTPVAGAPALDFDVMFSASKTTTFTYNETDNLYYLEQFGGPYIDGNNGEQLAFTNVIIMETPITNIPGDREGRVDVVTQGDGTGYFMCGGKYTEIKWSHEGETSPFVYTLPGGGEVTFGRGKTYICIVPGVPGSLTVTEESEVYQP